MKTVPRISDTEWEIMRIIWARHPISGRDVIGELMTRDATWHPKTARTLLSRLVQKKALDYEAQGRGFVYEPLVTERECVAAASESFLDRVFGGSFKPMLAHFAEKQKLTKEDLQELEQILEESPQPKDKKWKR